MKQLLYLILIGLFAFLNAQGITNTLGGSTSADKFLIENSDLEAGLVVTGEGNVGIGNSTPLNKLDVNGAINTISAYYINGSRFASVGNEGSANTIVGIAAAGSFLSTGDYNTFTGAYSGNNNTTGKSNAFFGAFAGRENTTGYNNTFLGTNAGRSNTIGGYNTFVGLAAGLNSVDTWGNTCVGEATGMSNISSSGNTYIGYWAGQSNLYHANTLIGYYAGVANVNGYYNTFIGAWAGHSSTGHSNIFLGTSAGTNEIGSNKLYIENSSSSMPLIGGDFSTNRVGINTASPTVTLDVSGTDAILIPVGTTAERPNSPIKGMIRFNSTTTKFEGYTGATWIDLH